ncbi:MAG: hypothetical protein GX465_12965 [Acidobacteria bacterium]|nr:hypothetical protein [Acidobacteriota bacterium]
MVEFFSQLGWRPTIGDPSVMGWLTVAAYALAALMCFIAASRSRIGEDLAARARLRRLWQWVGAFMAFLCLNKQLDLQTLLTEIGREWAVRSGWYGNRRIVQFLFVMAVAIIAIAIFVFIVRRTRLLLKERKLLLFGLCFMIVFIIVRASSFHHVGVFLGTEIWGIRVNWALELGGIGLIALSAARAIRNPC